MKKKIYYVILFILFNCLLAGAICYLNFVLRNKEYEGSQDKFKKWNPEHADVVFIGNSHQFCTVDPDILYDEYGIESFMLASSGQTVPMSYYAAMEAIELHKPDTIVFEVAYCCNDFRTLKGMDHCFFDGFPRCKARKEALRDLVDKDERIYFLMPLGIFHSRWKELTQTDFQDFPVSDRGAYHIEEVCHNEEFPIVDESVTEPMPEEMEKYMDKLVELCRENDVKLILYAAPFNGLYLWDENSTEDIMWRQTIFNYIGEYAEEKGVEYHNLFHEIEDLNIDYETDWGDTQHFNRTGQAKMTRYLAEKGYIY